MSTPGSLEVVVVDGTNPKFLPTVITPNATPGTCKCRDVHYLIAENTVKKLLQKIKMLPKTTPVPCVQNVQLIPISLFNLI